MRAKDFYNVAVYLRLSKDDGEAGKAESNSITSQRDIIRSFIRKQENMEIFDFYVDDGWSGANFDRPSFKRMMGDIEAGHIDCVIVKDLSRLGRDYIGSGRLIQKTFPEHEVRFIAINDNYDSLTADFNEESLVLPVKNFINDAYCRDISRKVKSQQKVMRESDQYSGAFAMYGYRKDPDAKNRLIIDRYAAGIVESIFDWKVDGYSFEAIADRLNGMGVLSPMEYKKSNGEKFTTGFRTKKRSKWSAQAVRRILMDETYIGTLVQGKSERVNYKVKKSVVKPADEWVRVPNAHEPIIDRETFDKVQERFQKSGRKWKRRDRHVLVGRVKCGCCSHNLRHSTGVGQPYYWCPGLNIYHVDGCVKRIEDFYLEEMILFQIQQHIMELGESDKLLQAEKEVAAAEVKALRKKCRDAERAIDKAKAQRMAEFEAYALGQKKSYDASIDEVEALRKKHEALMVQLSEAEDKVREQNRMKVHECFAVTKLTEELLDEYVESIDVHPGNEIMISWK